MSAEATSNTDEDAAATAQPAGTAPTPDAAEHLIVMTAALRDVWQLALRWQGHDDTEQQAGDIFTALSPLVAWEAEHLPVAEHLRCQAFRLVLVDNSGYESQVVAVLPHQYATADAGRADLRDIELHKPSDRFASWEVWSTDRIAGRDDTANDIEATGQCCCAGCVGMGPCARGDE
ncbi:hypothetical protein ACQP2C_32570 [Micromonospora zamorensis]|uniref:hypothetical protein n=1 Tax=Micromonospora zamorensis TaxID=709883 RepID=UPI003D95BA3F